MEYSSTSGYPPKEGPIPPCKYIYTLDWLLLTTLKSPGYPQFLATLFSTQRDRAALMVETWSGSDALEHAMIILKIPDCCINFELLDLRPGVSNLQNLVGYRYVAHSDQCHHLYHKCGEALGLALPAGTGTRARVFPVGKWALGEAARGGVARAVRDSTYYRLYGLLD